MSTMNRTKGKGRILLPGLAAVALVAGAVWQWDALVQWFTDWDSTSSDSSPVGHEHHHGPRAAADEPEEAPNLFACPMHPDVTAPFPGECPRCHMELTPAKKAPPDSRRFTCPMHPDVTASSPGECPRCHMELTPAKSDPDEIAHYTCSMHPSVKEPTPGACPLCNMDLQPVTRDELETGTLLVDAIRRQTFGIRTSLVIRRPLRKIIRAVGTLRWDEARIRDVNLRVHGWIERLHLDTTGVRIQRGDPLFVLYSPDIFAAQKDLLAAGRGSASGHLARSARQRLRLWGLTRGQISALEKRGRPREKVTILSSFEGVVIEKDVFEGSHVKAGNRLFRIAGTDPLWIDVAVFETDLPLVTTGLRATVTPLPDRGTILEGTVSYVYPWLDADTRTGTARIELPNPDGDLRPQMFADVAITLDLGHRLSLPFEALVHTGQRRIVFVDRGEGRLEPVEIETGARSGNLVEVISGLVEGDSVVTSGNFLVAAESRIRSAQRYWGADDDAE